MIAIKYVLQRGLFCGNIMVKYLKCVNYHQDIKYNGCIHVYLNKLYFPQIA